MTNHAAAGSLNPNSAQTPSLAMPGNAKLIAGVLVVVILATVAYSVVTSRSENRNQRAQSALYHAQKLVSTETPKIKKDAPPAPGAKTPPAPIEEPAENAKFDVDATMPSSVKALAAVVREFGSTRAGYDAALGLGDLYIRHGEPTKSVSWYLKAAEIAPGALERALAYAAQGYAYEDSGKLAEALQAFTKVSDSGEPSLKGDALLSVARVHQASGNKAKATETYDQVISQMPGTEAAKSAETLKSQLDQNPSGGKP